MQRPQIISVDHEAVLHGCMDDGFAPHYERVLKETFGIRSFFRVLDAGGAGVLSKLDICERGANAIESIRLAVTKGARHVIESTHQYGCAGYANAGYEFNDLITEESFHREEAKRIRARVERDLLIEFPYIRIDVGYFTVTPDGSKVVFKIL